MQVLRQIKFRQVIALAILAGTVQFCRDPSSSEPQALDILDLRITYDKLPGYLDPAEVTFDITFHGPYYITSYGDTLDHLAMKFAPSMWLEGLNADADALWFGPVAPGDSFQFKPVFQLTLDAENQWPSIDLHAMLYSGDIPPISIYDTLVSNIPSRYLFTYNTTTGRTIQDEIPY